MFKQLCLYLDLRDPISDAVIGDAISSDGDILHHIKKFYDFCCLVVLLLRKSYELYTM